MQQDEYSVTRPVQTRRRAVGGLFATACGIALPALTTGRANAQATDWPARPMRVIVPYPAGGAVDVIMRTMTREMAPGFPQPIVIDNKPGADSSIGAQLTVEAPADGYTWFVSAPSIFINPLLEKDLRWKQSDFTPVAGLAQLSSVICVPAGSAIRSVSDLIERGKVPPGLQYGDPGSNTTQSLAVRLLALETGAVFQSVPYRGAPPLVPDLVEGRLDLGVLPTSLALPLIKAAKLRGLAVLGEKRLQLLPDLATLAELGHPRATIRSWIGLHVRAGTPQALVMRISAAFGAMATLPQVQAALSNIGVDVLYLGADAFASFLETEKAKLVPLFNAGQAPAR